MCQWPYRAPEAQRLLIEAEVTHIEESTNPWCRPIVAVLKPDNTLQLCKDIEKLNNVSELNSYLMPQVDEHVERLGRVCFISMLD